ncbi:MAG: LuxR family transcriptional regulator [Candidatus Binatia bacterium]
MSVQLSDFIEASAKATRTEEVFHCLCTAVSSQDCSKIAFFAVTGEAQRAMTPSGSHITPLLASNYPEDYVCRYLRNRKYEIDPVLLLARQSLTPLVWEDVVDRLTLSEEQKILRVERRDAGLSGEVTCPVHGPRGQTFAVCFAHSHPREHDRAHLSELQVLAIHFYYAFTRVFQARARSVDVPEGLADNPPMSLTAARVLTHRERECLLWTARGKSASTISVILGLSENTINFYVKNAMRKLGTTNRVVAVVLAVRSGLIQP